VLLHLTAVVLLEGPRKTRHPGLPLALVHAAARNAARRYEDCAGDFAQPMLALLTTQNHALSRADSHACVLAGCWMLRRISIHTASVYPTPPPPLARIDCVGDERCLGGRPQKQCLAVCALGSCYGNFDRGPCADRLLRTLSCILSYSSSGRPFLSSPYAPDTKASGSARPSVPRSN
jgi:hypothetical protein